MVRIFICSATAFGENFSGNHSVILYDITERRQQEDLVKEHNALLTRQKVDLEATLGRI